MNYDPRLTGGTYERTLQMQTPTPSRSVGLTFGLPSITAQGSPYRLPGQNFDLRHDTAAPTNPTFGTTFSNWSLGVPVSGSILDIGRVTNAIGNSIVPQNIDPNAARADQFRGLADLILASGRNDPRTEPGQAYAAPSGLGALLTPTNILIAAAVAAGLYYVATS